MRKEAKTIVTYCLNNDTVKCIDDIKDRIVENYNIKLSKGQIIDLLVKEAAEKHFDISIKII